MDFNTLRDQVSNLTLYDIKAGVRKVQNAVMNYTELESKVREATNNEPWGASSSLMQEIANGTFNYQGLNEIMPMVYKRFTEKSTEEWRQIYKALQLLEFLIKNGSERVIDDARSHVGLLKMLRQFHYIDQNGKDQGINVRNRAKELAELLGDVERIRTERKKARANRSKFGGVEGGAGIGGAGGSRYGGFGSESGGAGTGGYGAYDGRVFGDGGGFGGETSGGFTDTQRRRERFDEYDEYDEGAVAAAGRRQVDVPRSSATAARAAAATKPPAEPPKAKEPEVDLFSFDEPAPTPSRPNATANGKTPAPTPLADLTGDADDEFDDFQSAAASSSNATVPPAQPTSTISSSTHFAAPRPQQYTQASNMTNLFSTISPPPQASQQTRSSAATPNYAAFSSPPPARPTTTTTSTPSSQAQQQKPIGTGYTPQGPNYFGSVSLQPQASDQLKSPTSPGGFPSPGATTKPGAAAGNKTAGGDAFASLLSGVGKKPGTPGAGGSKNLSLADMAKQRAQTGLYGADKNGSGGRSDGLI